MHMSNDTFTMDQKDREMFSKKKRKKDREINWLDLPDHILPFVMENFNDNKDCIRFGAVCRSWRSIYVENRHLYSRGARQLPLLMLPSEGDRKNHHTRSLYSLNEKKLLTFQLPVPHNQFCRGSSYGWLITTQKNLSDVRLVNPFLSVDNEIQLPPLTDVNESYGAGFFVKAVLSANPTINPKYVLMAIYGKYRRLAILKPGDKTWTYLDFTYNWIDDVVYHKDQLFAVNFFGLVFACDGNHPHPMISKVAAPPYNVQNDDKKYIVDSFGDILQIRKLFKVTDDSCYIEGFEVFKLDLVTSKWIHVTSLPGRTLFLGENNSSMSISSSDFPGCKANCIYFTYNYCEAAGSTMGIFNLEDGSVKPHHQMKSEAIFPPPIWIEPTLI